jgi:hypothetical protein
VPPPRRLRAHARSYAAAVGPENAGPTSPVVYWSRDRIMSQHGLAVPGFVSSHPAFSASRTSRILGSEKTDSASPPPRCRLGHPHPGRVGRLHKPAGLWGVGPGFSRPAAAGKAPPPRGSPAVRAGPAQTGVKRAKKGRESLGRVHTSE